MMSICGILSCCLIASTTAFNIASDRRIIDVDRPHRKPIVCAEDTVKWLNDWHKEAELFFTQAIITEWENNVNITEENEKNQNEADTAFKSWAKIKTEEGKKLFRELVDTCKQSWTNEDCCLQDEANGGAWTKEFQLRALDKILTYKIYGEKDMDASALEGPSLETYQNTLARMIRTYSTTKVVAMDGSAELTLEDIGSILTENSGKPSKEAYDAQKYYWSNWHKKVGRACKDDYEQFVEVSNEAAVANNYVDTGDSWRDWYEDENFEGLVDGIWDELKPLYEKLHGYARHMLSAKYGKDLVSNETDPIPAHLFGNMWAQDWAGLLGLLEPHPGVGERPDATPELEKMEILEMYAFADEFYQSLGLFPMTNQFWRNSFFEKREGVEMVCHASAWDFMAGSGISSNGRRGDYRIKQCTEKTQSEFVTLHHEMGHIQYFQQYAFQPIIFRSGANPGFHEAIGDTMALAVNTPAHLHEVGLLPKWSEDDESDETDLNFLMMTALDKITFLPFGFLMDKYRWIIFRGEHKPDQYQELWDELRLKYQGIKPPVERSSEDFDPAAKFHTSNNVPYIRYFISFVIQFQFYEKMCIKAKQYDPNDMSSKLYKCDFFNNLEAGELMQKLLMEGNSRNWKLVLEDFMCEGDSQCGDSGKLSANSILKYFKPLEEWLDQQQKTLNYPIGWAEDSEWTPVDFDVFPDEAELAAEDTTQAPDETTQVAEETTQADNPDDGADDGTGSTYVMLSTLLFCMTLLFV